MTKRLLYFSFLLLCYASAAQQLPWEEYIVLNNEKNINTELSEFSPLIWEDNLIYVKAGTKKELLDKNTKEGFFDLQICDKGKGAFLLNDRSLSNTLNSRFHEGPASLINNNLFFTRVNYDDRNKKQLTEDNKLLKIYESSFKDGKWTEPILSEINKRNIASCHPTADKLGRYIIFASDREGGFGKMDLYITYLIDNKWSEPQNLGNNINSAGNDWFPFINERNYLVYAQEGKSNQLDLFISKGIEGKWQKAVKLPFPINTQYDDFGMVIDQNGLEGYLSSNRPGGIGKDDLYNFSSLISLYAFEDPEYNLINLTVIDLELGIPISNAEIRYRFLTEEQAQFIDQKIFSSLENSGLSLKSNDAGKCELELKEGFTVLEVKAPGKKPWQLMMSNHGSQKDISVELANQEIEIKRDTQILIVEKEIPTKTKIKNVEVKEGAVIVFDNIYYDYNSDILTESAKNELRQLIKLMLENPKLKIELSAHTDARGKEDYNMQLSNRRAQKAKSYLIAQGIPTSNIIARGYGESKIRNHCIDGKNCSEAEHIYNRRTEVKILEK